VSAEARVAAVVLTFDAPESLRSCLGALGAQSTPVSCTIVVDNSAAATSFADDVDEDIVVVRKRENVGPAGGYAIGLTQFLETECDYAWVMDDDCEAEPDALERALGAGAADGAVVMSTMIDRATGEVTNTHGWCGVLIPRSIVMDVGVPDATLFWWTEDTEYLQWRIPRAGWPLVRSDARVIVGRSRASAAKPAWKYYYEARNQVHYRLHTQAVDDTPLPQHLKFRVRAWRAGRAVTKLGARALTRESSGRLDKFRMVARGTYDGMRGRLGKRVQVDDSHRPETR
jgi:rhamnopyranosyl-N-acetylglucosaminyl-diphospho-decaprenol beta-1,3/1,4-galactofuranosyltransferase